MLPSETYDVLVLEDLIRAGRKADAVRFLRGRTGCSAQQASEIVAVMQSVLRSAPHPLPSSPPCPSDAHVRTSLRRS